MASWNRGLGRGNAMRDRVRNKSRLRLLLLGSAVGVVYGLAIRFSLNSNVFNWLGGAMTWAFLFGVPFAMGFITIFVIERRQALRFWVWVVWPWIPILAGALGTLLAFLEGMICIVMFLPIALFCASLGGIMAGVIADRLGGSKDLIAGAVLLFPLAFGPWEHHVLYSKEIHTTANYVDIHAPSPVIWSNIERVPAIRPGELPQSWSHRIGFPNPVEATLPYEGIGGVRHATFSGGVLFIETIDTWEIQRRLGFSIKAQTDQIPNTTLDKHVRVGGPFFDVLHGEYRLEPLDSGVIRLHLSSQQRLSTDFNWYARIWSDATMSALQGRILKVIGARCEREATLRPTEN